MSRVRNTPSRYNLALYAVQYVSHISNYVYENTQFPSIQVDICIVNVYMHIIELQSASKMVFEVAHRLYLRRTKNNAFLVECEKK